MPQMAPQYWLLLYFFILWVFFSNYVSVLIITPPHILVEEKKFQREGNSMVYD